MKKEELLKLDGMTEDLASKVLDIYKTDIEDMVPRTRLNEVIKERDNAKTDHADVLKQLDELKKTSGDNESLKNQIQKLQDDAKEAQKTHDAEIQRLKIDNAVESALITSKALNTKAVKALLNLEGAEFDADGSIKGLADQIKALQTAEDSKMLFGERKMKGASAGESGDDGDGGVDTSKMTYSQMIAYMEAHPDAKI